MSSLAPDAPAPAALSPWKSSGTLIVVVAGFFTAVTCGLMIGRAFPSADAGTSARAALARAALHLLHAQEETIRWEASQNKDIAKLREDDVEGLNKRLKDAKNQFAAKDRVLADLKLKMSEAEDLKNNANAQIAKIQKIDTAFHEADAERRKAEAAQMSTSGIQINYDQLQKEWNDMTKDALEKIQIAEDHLHSIQDSQPGWEASRDKLTAEQKAEIKAAYEASETKVKVATEAITATKELKKKQLDQLDQAILKISNK